MVTTLRRPARLQSRPQFSPQSSKFVALVQELGEDFKDFENLIIELDGKLRSFEEVVRFRSGAYSTRILAEDIQKLLYENQDALKSAGKYETLVHQLITFCAIAGITLSVVKGVSIDSKGLTQPLHQPSIERVQAVHGLNTVYTPSVQSQYTANTQTLQGLNTVNTSSVQSLNNRSAILKVIRFAEGTADARGYNRLFGGREIEDLSRHPDICVKFGSTCSTAVGAYQFLTTTWESLNLPDFSPANQDKGAIELIRRRGALGDVDAGRFELAIGKLSPEWASLPRWDGDKEGTYRQPVKSMQKLREVYVSSGGSVKALSSPSAERVKPLQDQYAGNTRVLHTNNSAASIGSVKASSSPSIGTIKPLQDQYNSFTTPAKTGIGSLLLNFFTPKKVEAAQSSANLRVVANAKKWQGQHYKPGQFARCADFVRHVLTESGLEVGVSSNPVDTNKEGDGRSPELAQSFFGSDIGQLVWNKNQLQPGDLVAFSNTYGNFRQGTITHVGIYAGSGMIIDRSTSSKPVFYRSINTFNFAVGVRPNAYK